MVETPRSYYKRDYDGIAEPSRKSWTVEEEQRLLQLLAEFENQRERGIGPAQKGRSKFLPMASKLNKEFHHRDRAKYPHRSWENLRVKVNNLRSKYETVKKRASEGGRGLDETKAIEWWPHFLLCQTVFGSNSTEAREEIERCNGSDEEARRSQSNSNNMMVPKPAEPEPSTEDHISSALIEAIHALEKNYDRHKADSDRLQEERDRRVQIEIEKLRLETRNVLAVRLEELRHEQTLRLKELEMKLILQLHNSKPVSASNVQANGKD